MTGIDPNTGDLVRLFDPRQQPWPEHFEVSGNRIVGRTVVGRTTAELLEMNSRERLRIRETVQRLRH